MYSLRSRDLNYTEFASFNKNTEGKKSELDEETAEERGWERGEEKKELAR